MFENQIEIIKNSFLDYFANSQYFLIFLIAVLFLFVEENKKENRCFLIYYPFLLLMIIINPICASFILKVIPESVYYRMFWMVPFGIVIAYLGALFVYKTKKRIKRILFLFFFIVIIAHNGNRVYNSYTFEKADNLYKIPDEFLEVSLELSKIPLEYKKAMVPVEMVGYVRQIDASTKLAYPRRPYGDYEKYIIIKYYIEGNINELVNICYSDNINIIVYDRSIICSEPLENYGFEFYYQTEHYNIFISRDIINLEKNDL